MTPEERQALRARVHGTTASVALVAAPPADGGPAHRIAADYGAKGKKGKGGRKVASKAGEKRYGLPIGTPLDGTNSKRKGEAATKRGYETFMAANTAADQRTNARWMSTDDLGRTAEALFSFDSDNERDQSARTVLVKELADRGVDPAQFGYKGAPVVLNPNPKEDPTVKAVRLDQSKAETAQKKSETDAARAKREAEKKAAQEAAAAKKNAAAAARAKIAKELINGRDRSDLVPRSVTAAFNPRQPRDKRGRWIDMGAFVHFSEGLGGKKQSGKVVGVDQSGKYKVATKSGEKLVDGSKLEVVSAKARLDAPVDTAPAAPAAPAQAQQTLPELTDQEFKDHTQAVERSVKQAIDAGLATDAQFSLDGKGEVWTPERAKLHNEIVNEVWAKAANVPNEGKGLFSGGLGGAGKTTTLGNPATGIDQAQYLTINPDDIKEVMAAKGMVPETPDAEIELSPMEKVALIHEESSWIANLLAQRAYAEKKNVTWDITMASEGSVAKRITEMKAKGYGEMQAVFVDIPVEKSVERAMSRYQRGMEARRNGKGDGGRYVPPSIIRKNVSTSFSSANRMNFEALRDQFDNWQVWDNSVDGRSARMVYSKTSTDLARLTDEARAGKTDNDRLAVAA